MTNGSIHVGGQEVTKSLSDLTLNAVKAESIRAHLKHHRPDKGSGSLFDDGLTILARIAALVEEVGEVAEELMRNRVILEPSHPTYKLDWFLINVIRLGQQARALTYDHDGPPGLNGPGLIQLPDTVDRDKLAKELIQVANVALSWAQQIESSV